MVSEQNVAVAQSMYVILFRIVFGRPSLVSVPMLGEEIKSQVGPKVLGPIISNHRSQPVSKIYASKK